ncbi:MAG: polyphosphate kinase 2 [Pirellulales bacterium]
MKKEKRDKRKRDATQAPKATASGSASSKQKLSRKEYEKELEKLQIELVRLQAWVKHTGARIVVVFEGRDAAGKGGVIKRITERVSSRVFRVVALPVPSDREKTQIYVQRYVARLPAAGEIVLFDRSWYNRLGVERVLGFCTEREYERFLRTCDRYEQSLVDDGIMLIKYWLSVSQQEQEKRFQARIDDPLRQWKLSPTDLESVRQWYAYSIARDAMFAATDTDFAPWYVVKSDDKRRARLNCIRHLLNLIPYEDVPHEAVSVPKRDTKHQYNDVASLASRRHVPESY